MINAQRNGNVSTDTDADTAAIRTLLDEVFARLANLAIGSGLTATEFAAGANKVAATLPQNPRPVPPDALACVLYAAHTLTYWHSEPDYLDDAGRPLSLPLFGEVSVEALAKRACPGTKPESVVEHLQRHKTIMRHGDKWKPAGDSVTFEPHSAEHRLHGLVVLRGLLRTLDKKTSSPADTGALFELHAKNGHLPMSERAFVLRNARRRGKKFLASLDGDMKQREKPNLAASRKTHLSVGVYVYEEDIV